MYQLHVVHHSVYQLHVVHVLLGWHGLPQAQLTGRRGQEEGCMILPANYKGKIAN